MLWKSLSTSCRKYRTFTSSVSLPQFAYVTSTRSPISLRHQFPLPRLGYVISYLPPICVRHYFPLPDLLTSSFPLPFCLRLSFEPPIYSRHQTPLPDSQLFHTNCFQAFEESSSPENYQKFFTKHGLRAKLSGA